MPPALGRPFLSGRHRRSTFFWQSSQAACRPMPPVRTDSQPPLGLIGWRDVPYVTPACLIEQCALSGHAGLYSKSRTRVAFRQKEKPPHRTHPMGPPLSRSLRGQLRPPRLSSRKCKGALVSGEEPLHELAGFEPTRRPCILRSFERRDSNPLLMASTAMRSAA